MLLARNETENYDYEGGNTTVAVIQNVTEGAIGHDDLDVVEVVVIVIMSVIAVVGFQGNLSVAIVIINNPCLRQSMTNLFVLNLVLVDLLACVVALPLAIVAYSVRNSTHDVQLCEVSGFSSTSLMLCSMLTLCVISMDRFYSIAMPLHHAAHATPLIALAVILGVWLVGILVASLPCLGLNSYKFKHRERMCSFEWAGEEKDRAFVMAIFIVSFLIPSIVILAMYSSIFCIARKAARTVAPRPSESTHSTVMHHPEQEISSRMDNLQLPVYARREIVVSTIGVGGASSIDRRPRICKRASLPSSEDLPFNFTNLHRCQTGAGASPISPSTNDTVVRKGAGVKINGIISTTRDSNSNRKCSLTPLSLENKDVSISSSRCYDERSVSQQPHSMTAADDDDHRKQRHLRRKDEVGSHHSDSDRMIPQQQRGQTVSADHKLNNEHSSASSTSLEARIVTLPNGARPSIIVQYHNYNGSNQNGQLKLNKPARPPSVPLEQTRITSVQQQQQQQPNQQQQHHHHQQQQQQHQQHRQPPPNPPAAAAAAAAVPVPPPPRPKHQKAFRTVMLIVMSYLLLWGPYFVCQLHHSQGGAVSPNSKLFVSWVGFTSYTVHPFLYGVMNRLIRQELCQLYRTMLTWLEAGLLCLCWSCCRCFQCFQHTKTVLGRVGGGGGEGKEEEDEDEKNYSTAVLYCMPWLKQQELEESEDEEGEEERDGRGDEDFTEVLGPGRRKRRKKRRTSDSGVGVGDGDGCGEDNGAESFFEFLQRTQDEDSQVPESVVRENKSQTT